MHLREFVNAFHLADIYDVERERWTGVHVPGGPIEGWDTDTVVTDLIKEMNAKDAIELGSWKGASAVAIVNAFPVPYAGADIPTLLCVDTWLGSTEHVLGTYGGAYDTIRPHGSELPLLREFIRNICGEHIESVVFPFPATTAVAAAVLRAHNVQVDLVYVDASHEYEDVARDLRAYWPLVRPGGVLVGDDYAAEWPGVMQAVDEFTMRMLNTFQALAPEFRGRKYVFRKPTDRDRPLAYDPLREFEPITAART